VIYFDEGPDFAFSQYQFIIGWNRFDGRHRFLVRTQKFLAPRKKFRVPPRRGFICHPGPSRDLSNDFFICAGDGGICAKSVYPAGEFSPDAPRRSASSLQLDRPKMTEVEPSQELIKIDPSQNVETGLMVLRLELAVAADLFERSSPDASRSTVQRTLVAIESLLRTTFGANDPKPLIPLRRLIYALHDLDRGTVVPLLAPQKINHRPRDSLLKEGLMAFAAACMELLIESGVRRKDAARRVAKYLHAKGYRSTRDRTITAQNVEDWRDRMRSESPSESEAVARFRRLVEIRANFPDPQTAANTILEGIPRVVPPTSPRNAT
jgi:hypothetical protein